MSSFLLSMLSGGYDQLVPTTPVENCAAARPHAL